LLNLGVCSCFASRLREQKGMKAGSYDVFVAGDSQGGTIRLLMHRYTGLPASWWEF